MAAVKRKRYPPNNVQANRKPCIDCTDSGITTKRKAPHPGPRCATHHRAKRRVRSSVSWAQRILDTYGITEQEYWEIYEHQGGKCYICRRATGARRRLSVDHCHETGVVRGLLDTACNRNVLGHLRDDPEAFQRAIDYLKKPPATEVIGWRTVPSTGAPVKANTRKRVGAT
jgi:hypothetical protein